MDQKDQRRRSVWVKQAGFSKIAQRKQNLLNMSTACTCLFKKIDAPYAFTGKRTQPKENIETLNMESRSGLSSIKLIEETDVSVQIYSFLDVRAVRYEENPEKDGRRRDIRDIGQEGTYCA